MNISEKEYQPQSHTALSGYQPTAADSQKPPSMLKKPHQRNRSAATASQEFLPHGQRRPMSDTNSKHNHHHMLSRNSRNLQSASSHAVRTAPKMPMRVSSSKLLLQ